MNKVTSTSSLALCIAISAVLLFFVSSAHAAKLYKWVDKDGNISYQDQPPPENVKILKEDTLEAPSAASKSKGGNSTPIIVYTVADCPACESLLTRLTEMGVPTDNRPLNQDVEAQRRILDQSGGVTVPTILLGDKIITNIDAGTLSAQLKEAGYLLEEDPTAIEPTPSTAEQQAE